MNNDARIKSGLELYLLHHQVARNKWAEINNVIHHRSKCYCDFVKYIKQEGEMKRYASGW